MPADLGDRLARYGPPTAVVSYSVRVAHLGRALAARFGVPHLVRCQNLDSRYFDDLATGQSGIRKLAYRVEAAKVSPLSVAVVTFSFGVSTRDAFAWRWPPRPGC